MTDERKDKDRSTLAAEHALRLLGDDDPDAARIAAEDPEFAAEAARWRGRLAPLAEEIEPAAPPPHVWSAIADATGRAPMNDNVATLRNRLNRWRAATAAVTAIAATLAGLLVMQPQPPPVSAPVERPASAPMVAMLGTDGQAAAVVASWDSSARQLVLAVPGDMPADARHAHELWVIPVGGKPHSLGTMPAGKRMHMRLAEAIANLMQQGATIAISVEPPGGSPNGSPTGPVVASGSLSRA